MNAQLQINNPSTNKNSVNETALKQTNTESVFDEVHKDYICHGSSIFDAGFISLVVYRFGRWANNRRTWLARKLANRVYGAVNIIVSTLTRVWIPPQVIVGDGFHIMDVHGSISIHPHVVIGKRCGIMHNVTIGTNMVGGVPKIGDDVFIGVNSTVLGDIVIGDRVRIEANTAVTTNVPSDSVVIGSPATVYPRLGPCVSSC